MKLSKKMTSVVLLTVLVASLAVLFTGCYRVNPAAAEDVYGTYELTTYTRTYPVKEGEDEAEKIDFLKDYGAKSYLVVKDDGYGYYFYADKETELYGKEVKITLEESTDEEKAGLIAYVKYDFDGEHGDRLGVNQKNFGKIVLNYTGKPTGFRFAKENDRIVTKKDYSETVKYTKVSNKTDFTTVRKKLNIVPPMTKYEMNPYDGKLLELRVGDFERKDCPLVYFACRFDAKNMLAEVWYGLKGEGAEVVDKHETGARAEAIRNDVDYMIGLKIGGYSFVKNFTLMELVIGENIYGHVDVTEYDSEILSEYITSEKEYYGAVMSAENKE